MPKKKRKQLSNKQILMITLCILGAGTLMLVASILLAPSAEPSAPAQGGSAVVAQALPEQSVAESTSQTNSQNQAQVPAQPQKTEEVTVNVKPEKTETKPQTSSQPSQTQTAQPQQAQSAPAQSVSKPAQDIQNRPSQSATVPASTAATSTATAPASSAANTSSNAAKPKSNGAKLVFVFDDAGHNLNQLEPFLKLPFKVVIAVLPGLPHSAEAAAAARKAGKQVILHQPMQAVNLSVDPGPSAIKPDMHTYEIEDLVRKNLAEIGPVVGLNNHEGSLITATQSAIGAVLDVCKAENIFFLDSRTNAETKAPQAALERGMKIYERDIFLDNEPGRDDIIAMIKKGLAVADKKGHAIMIGHIWSDGLAAIIKELYPDLVAQGYVFTDISGLN